MAIRALILVAMGFLLARAGHAEVAPLSPEAPWVCAESKASLAKSPKVLAFSNALFGALRYRAWSSKEPCIVPTEVLDFADKKILIATAMPAYQAHACTAALSGYVVRKTATGLRYDLKIEKFAEIGESCVAGRFKTLRIAGGDAFAVEGSGGGQGARAGFLDFFLVLHDEIRHVPLPGLSCVWVDYSKVGPISVDYENIASSWRIGGPAQDQLHLNFSVAKPKHKAKRLRTVWQFDNGGLKLIKGKTPDAFQDGNCL